MSTNEAAVFSFSAFLSALPTATVQADKAAGKLGGYKAALSAFLKSGNRQAATIGAYADAWLGLCEAAAYGQRTRLKGFSMASKRESPIFRALVTVGALSDAGAVLIPLDAAATAAMQSPEAGAELRSPARFVEWCMIVTKQAAEAKKAEAEAAKKAEAEKAAAEAEAAAVDKGFSDATEAAAAEAEAAAAAQKMAAYAMAWTTIIQAAEAHGDMVEYFRAKLSAHPAILRPMLEAATAEAEAAAVVVKEAAIVAEAEAAATAEAAAIVAEAEAAAAGVGEALIVAQAAAVAEAEATAGTAKKTKRKQAAAVAEAEAALV